MASVDDVNLLFRGELLLDAIVSMTKLSWSEADYQLLSEFIVLIRRIRYDKVRRQQQHLDAKRKRRTAARIRSTKT